LTRLRVKGKIFPVDMEEHRHFPSTNQLSVLLSTILLAYALTPFLRFPDIGFSITLPFGFFTFPINFGSLISILVALLAGFGMDSLLRTHPHFKEGTTFQHCILPAFTAWVLGYPLGIYEFGAAWWVMFSLGGSLLVLVFIAEYIVMDFDDLRFALSSIGLTALSFALFLILAIALKASNVRLYLALPTLGVSLALIVLRTIYLRLNGRWIIFGTAAIVMVVLQIAIGLQYLPVSPLGYGLVLVGAAYGLTNFLGAVEDGRPWRASWQEPVLVMALLIGLGFLLGW
jgi:hypothetical protein